jgi:hypothetical protein
VGFWVDFKGGHLESEWEGRDGKWLGGREGAKRWEKIKTMEGGRRMIFEFGNWEESSCFGMEMSGVCKGVALEFQLISI